MEMKERREILFCLFDAVDVTLPIWRPFQSPFQQILIVIFFQLTFKTLLVVKVNNKDFEIIGYNYDPNFHFVLIVLFLLLLF